MRRREFIKLLGGAAVGWPLAASAQVQPKIPRVGHVLVGSLADWQTSQFRQGLRELGYIEGQTILMELRWAEGRLERIPELVAELVGLKVDVLAALSGPAAVAAKNATQTIPIVIIANDPVGQGLVGSLSRPGGNVTGLSYLSEDIIGKFRHCQRIGRHPQKQLIGAPDDDSPTKSKVTQITPPQLELFPRARRFRSRESGRFARGLVRTTSPRRKLRCGRALPSAWAARLPGLSGGAARRDRQSTEGASAERY